MLDGRKRWRWSDGEKLEICGQARVTGVSVAQVARRYVLNANMLHAWLREPHFVGGVSNVAPKFSVLDRVQYTP